MKIELRKESNISTLPIYSVYKNDKLILGTVSHDYQFTKKQFEMCVASHKDALSFVEVLDVFESN